MVVKVEHELQIALKNLKSLDGLIGAEPILPSNKELLEVEAKMFANPDDADARKTYGNNMRQYNTDLEKYNKGLNDFEKIKRQNHQNLWIPFFPCTA